MLTYSLIEGIEFWMKKFVMIKSKLWIDITIGKLKLCEILYNSEFTPTVSPSGLYRIFLDLDTLCHVIKLVKNCAVGCRYMNTRYL